jgi:hypothetical protein
MIQGTRAFRTPVVGLNMRQQVASARHDELTSRLVRPMGIVLLAAIVTVFALSQFLHWQIVREQGLLQQVEAIRTTKGSDNMNLLAQRAKLMSKAHIKAVAAARLDLYPPARGQVHRL